MNAATATALLVWRIVGLVDDGVSADIEQVRRRVDDGTLFPWLAETFNVNVPDDAALLLLEEFRSLDNAVDAARKFLVERDGMVLLLAWCIQLYQSALPSS